MDNPVFKGVIELNKLQIVYSKWNQDQKEVEKWMHKEQEKYRKCGHRITDHYIVKN